MTKTPEAFIQAVRDLAAWDPDYVDPLSAKEMEACQYKSNKCTGYPGCIVGQAAARVGFTQSEMLEAASVARFIHHLFGGQFTARQVDWVRRVQLAQDEGVTWRDAVYEADMSVPL